MSKIINVNFSIEEIKKMMENKIIHDHNYNIEEIINSDLSQFNDGDEDKFILTVHAKTNSRSKLFTREQVKHILAQAAADENGEAVDEIEGVGSAMHMNGDITVEYKAFDDAPEPRGESWFTPAIKFTLGEWVKYGKPLHPDDQILNWKEYLLNLVDTTECDDCPLNRVCPDSLAK